MSSQSKTYAITEVVGTSPVGVAEAIEGAIATASGTLRNLDWFEVMSIRGAVDGRSVKEYQVTVKLGFRYGE
jgi:flavin-binding protein dodecin